jgi:hypothetical protein
MIDGYAATHSHNLGLLMLRGISKTGHFGEAKQCVINAFDTTLPHVRRQSDGQHPPPGKNMDEEIPAPDMTAPEGPAPLISAFVATGRGSNTGRGHNPRGTRAGRGLPNKCSA